ncbi:unnamed protein product [Haemonchus placei]|uniref:G_PROTEIN_RECEP_F1_2 domain-containing protein n=1 Tax=Haemonchus placei TaxID=6290 RepID=A0A0N4WR37_HAEPC|nr:unnamed protein product [Haemonchus placei]
MYMVTHWDPTYFSLDPYYIVFSSVFFIVQLKINLTLTISIALERTLRRFSEIVQHRNTFFEAIFFPVTYRKMPSSEYAMFCLLIGCLLATIDVVLDFVYFPFKDSPNCGSVGCFVTSEFSRYWGTSNMVMGFIVILLTALLIAKLQLIEKESKSRRTFMNNESRRFQQANRTSAGILLTSLVFVTIPSNFVGIVDMLGYSIFRKVGPFYLTGLLSAGACNAIVYIVLNRDMRDLAKGSMPYTIYMTIHWHPTYFSLDPYYIVFASVFLIAQLKINLTLTISIAFERTLAIFFPVTYRKMPSSEYATICLLTGCLLAAVDLVLEFVYFPFKDSPNCGSVGCFVNSEFRHYWGTSNMIMGFIVILLTALLIAKLQLIEKESNARQTIMNNESRKFQQKVGPFYITGLLCAGESIASWRACNTIVYIVLNRDMRDLAKRCFSSNVSNIGTSMPSTRIFSTTVFRNKYLR